ncbi:MAG: peptide chain release factor 1 [Anaerohalosphaeraceae bacterium]|nr:peptide chain release factor 1 [Anaerohalosphaeraceae bacterium]
MSEQEKGLISKLEELDGRYVEIEQQMNDPEISADIKKIIPLSKEQSKLRNLVEKYREYKCVTDQIAQAQEMLDDPETEDDFKALAEEELRQLSGSKAGLYEQIKDTLVMADDDAIGSVMVEIRAGTGGDEAALFARNLFDMYNHYAEKQGWKVEQLDFSASELGGFREVIFNIKGRGVWTHFGYEGGGHRVQRVPETESQGRIHTSAVTVAVLPEPEDVEINIPPSDVAEHVSRAGGPGGQSVNKINSAIKLEHKPTGITVSMRDEKSQHKNRSKAWRILRSRVYEHYKAIENAQRDSQRKTMIGSGDRSQRIRTYNFPQNRVTDHRVNISLYSLDKIMMGNMEELIEAIVTYDKKLRLENL